MSKRLSPVQPSGGGGVDGTIAGTSKKYSICHARVSAAWRLCTLTQGGYTRKPRLPPAKLVDRTPWAPSSPRGKTNWPNPPTSRVLITYRSTSSVISNGAMGPCAVLVHRVTKCPGFFGVVLATRNLVARSATVNSWAPYSAPSSSGMGSEHAIAATS